MTTPPVEPKGVTVILATAMATEGLTAHTAVFPKGHDWEWNAGPARVTIYGVNRERLGEFRDGQYLGIGFRHEVRVNRIKEPVPTTTA